MKQGGRLFLASLLFTVMFFCLAKPSQAAPDVIISEIAWMGTASSSYAEWIELANTTADDIALDGWTVKAKGWSKVVSLIGTLKANGYYLLERTRDETLPNVTADLIYTGDLKNSGDLLELKDSTGAVVDSIDATTGWPGGDNASKSTLERSADLSWATSSVQGGTPKAPNSNQQLIIVVPPVDSGGSSTVEVVPTPAVPAANSTPISLPKAISIYPGEVVINELVSDPLDGEPEWVELYLVADKTINLDGATLEDGSQAKTALSGSLSPSRRFLVIENPNGNLNNSGDLLILRDGNKSVVDQVAYGDWNKGQFNAPVARDGASLARRFDGINTYNAAADWAVTRQPTKQIANQIVSEDGETPSAPANPKALQISELLPDPFGDESGEFVEIYNQSEETAVLAGWRLQNKSGQIYKFSSSTLIKAHEYKAFFRKDTHLVLVNDNGSLKLFPPSSDRASQSVSYKNGQTGQSYLRDIDGSWHWTESPTPGAMNRLSQKNQAPTVSIYVKSPVEVGELAVFDSSDTFDPEGDTLSYSWQFGDGATSSQANPEHVYYKKGSYKIILIVSDGQNSVTATELVKVTGKDISKASIAEQAGSVGKSAVYINEALPNPVGSDDAEFIELFNAGNERVNLLGWSLDDGPDGSNPYKINEEIIIEPKEYMLFERSETDIAMNNNADEVRLFDANGQLVSQMGYQKAAEGMAWARTTDGTFVWSAAATPRAMNIIDGRSTKFKMEKSVKGAKISKPNDQSEQEVGDEAVIQCAVTSLPSQLASQYFYCENDRGWQIYNYKKDFPAVSVNDFLEVRGVVAQTNGNWRLKTKSASSIQKIGEKSLPAIDVSLEDLGTGHYGKLVRIQGEVTKKSGSSFYLDDNTAEAVVQLKASAGLSTANIALGENYDLVGIVQSSQSGLKILPRSREDIKRRRSEERLGELATGTKTWLAVPDRTKGYVAVVGSGGVLLVGLWLMKRMAGN